MQLAGAYGAVGGQQGYGQHGAVLLKAPAGRKRRLNIVAICVNVFLPWLVFCLIAAMLSFEMHYTKPETCQTYVIIVLSLMIIAGVLDVCYMLWKQHAGQAGFATPSWVLFLCVTSIVALGLAVVLGNRNFWVNSQPFFDVTALNSYNGVDPSSMRGQELMDAGRVLFVPGTRLDLKKSMGFKNMETYCVVPITGGAVVGDPQLASYDFWAVGKDCCSADTGDFQCGNWNNPTARAGIRVVRDEDRAFFRLAVQQAQSAYQIKAIHPLFFHWVRDPVAETYEYQQDAFKTYMVGMFAYFCFQILLVYIAANVFSKFA